MTKQFKAPKRARVLALIDQGFRTVDIVRYARISKSHVTMVRASTGKPSRQRLIADHEEFVRLVADGHTSHWIAHLLGCSESTVSRYRVKHGLRRPLALSCDDVRRLASDGLSDSEIAETLNSTRGLVASMRHNHGVKIGRDARMARAGSGSMPSKRR
jgi:hypothetical protein